MTTITKAIIIAEPRETTSVISSKGMFKVVRLEVFSVVVVAFPVSLVSSLTMNILDRGCFHF